jgi:hypothetical protein
MSFFSGIASDIKSLATDPGKVAKDICDAVLPQNLKAVGDVVGGAIDVETGNPLQALSHMADALKDLPQMAQGLPGTTTGKAASTPAGTAAAEPAPPPTRAPSLQQVISELTALAGGATTAAQPACTAAGTATTTTPAATATTATTTATAAPAATAAQAAAPPVNGTPANVSASVSYRAPTSARATTANAAGSQQLSVSLNVGGTAVTVTESLGTRMVGQHNPATGATTWQRVPTTPTLTVTTGPNTTAGSAAPAAVPATPAAATAAASGAPAATSTTATTATTTAVSGTTSTATPAVSPTGTAAAGSAAAPSSLSSLMSMSNDQFMQAVTSGNIPADVANNPSAMAEIQARMNQITQMNQLVTSMMAAMHQMQMAIIQNIRV